MKIQPQHILPYLSYGLKAKFMHPVIKHQKIGVITNVYNLYDEVKLSIDFSDDEHIWMYKPILRPLSDLTKEEIIKLGYSGMHTLELAIQYDDLLYRDIRFFNENHYDYQGLIENNLGIDINTL